MFSMCYEFMFICDVRSKLTWFATNWGPHLCCRFICVNATHFLYRRLNLPCNNWCFQILQHACIYTVWKLCRIDCFKQANIDLDFWSPHWSGSEPCWSESDPHWSRSGLWCKESYIRDLWMCLTFHSKFTPDFKMF